MYVIISEYDMVKAYGNTQQECASQVLNWKLNYDTGELLVDDKREMSYTRHDDDKINGFTRQEMMEEAIKDLVKIAKRKRYKFFKSLD